MQVHQAKQRYLDELSTSLFHFILPLLPTPEELNTKQQVRVLIEKLIRTVEPGARLLAFGSTANGFSLRNSDMDLCVLLDRSSDEAKSAPPASDLVNIIGHLLEQETNFAVKALPKAYVPIIKLTLSPSPGLPFGIACDIGFENRLALENTRLLLTYATIDPARVRTMVLFIKVWSKRRRINSPYRGTLSSYGFTLLVLFFLIHVQNPPVLPNLQQIPPLVPKTKEELELDGHNIWFFDDTELLRKEWSSANFQSVGELLIDFFKFYCQNFAFNTDVVSIRAGLLTKESKMWTTDSDVGSLNEMSRDRNRLCIEDPFETSYNVARTVTKDGLYTIRGEFMRASRILTSRPGRAVTALAQLCEERDEELMRAPRSRSPAGGSRSPYAFGSGYRHVDRLSPPKQYLPFPASSTISPHLSAAEYHQSNGNLYRSVSASATSRQPYTPIVSSPFSPVHSPAGSPRGRSAQLSGMGVSRPGSSNTGGRGLGMDLGPRGTSGGGSGGYSSNGIPISSRSGSQHMPKQDLSTSPTFQVQDRGRPEMSAAAVAAAASAGSTGSQYGMYANSIPPVDMSVPFSDAFNRGTGGTSLDRQSVTVPGSTHVRGRTGNRINNIKLGSGLSPSPAVGSGAGQQILTGAYSPIRSTSPASSAARRAISTPPPGSTFGLSSANVESIYLNGAGSSSGNDRFYQDGLGPAGFLPSDAPSSMSTGSSSSTTTMPSIPGSSHGLPARPGFGNSSVGNPAGAPGSLVGVGGANGGGSSNSSSSHHVNNLGHNHNHSNSSTSVFSSPTFPSAATVGGSAGPLGPFSSSATASVSASANTSPRLHYRPVVGGDSSNEPAYLSPSLLLSPESVSQPLPLEKINAALNNAGAIGEGVSGTSGGGGVNGTSTPPIGSSGGSTASYHRFQHGFAVPRSSSLSRSSSRPRSSLGASLGGGSIAAGDDYRGMGMVATTSHTPTAASRLAHHFDISTALSKLELHASASATDLTTLGSSAGGGSGAEKGRFR
ncbi:cid1 [Phaffia rhodozyma]|uniref:polynucleotide adenylyltransferase n=1 Tax=Phaffia rhodozyma TaxID=264483 RepID=A0A0F7SQ87_PHARH|nr:cid1 [Phaffia rhodozyma]